MMIIKMFMMIIKSYDDYKKVYDDYKKVYDDYDDCKKFMMIMMIFKSALESSMIIMMII